MAVREGLATFYLDDVPCKTCFMALIPNNEPMWVAACPDGFVQKPHSFEDMSASVRTPLDQQKHAAA